MKITHITAQNYLGARAVELPVTTPIVLLAGKNGAGKSSLQEAIRHALGGEAARVALKKDFKALMSDGASSSPSASPSRPARPSASRCASSRRAATSHHRWMPNGRHPLRSWRESKPASAPKPAAKPSSARRPRPAVARVAR